MMFSNRPDQVNHSLHLIIDSKTISFQDSTKFLCIIVDSKLSFHKHISLIIQKMFKTIGIFYKLKQNSAPKKVMISMYYSLIYPCLVYGNLVWDKTYHFHINQLKLLQKKIIRMINSSE